MYFLKKFKETFIAILPLVAIVTALNFILMWSGAESLPEQTLADFFVACGLVVLGQVVFLIGIDNSLNTMGEMTGAAAVGFKKIGLILAVAFVFGFLITIADPDIQVLSNLVEDVMPGNGGFLLMVVVALGVGIYTVLAFIKTIFEIKFKYMIFASYAVIFVLAILSPKEFVALAFDSGGVITGPITVPFILALGIGVAAVRGENSSDDSFGTVALAAVGPIIAILILGIVSGGGHGTVDLGYSSQHFGTVLGATMWDVFLGVAPIALAFYIFQLFFIRLPAKKILSIGLGVGLVYVGLVLFLAGINYGFSAAGFYIGTFVASTEFRWLLVPVGAAIGVATVFTEPSIKVLGEQVEEVTSGNIKKTTLTISLAVGVGFAVMLGVIKVLFSISFWWLIVPAVGIVLTLMIFTPDVFTSIAFDGGGVASGPITATFTLPLVIGIAAAAGGEVVENILLYGFGLVFLVSIIPPIIIQTLGLVGRMKENRILRLEQMDLEEIVQMTGGVRTEDFQRAMLLDFDYSGLQKNWLKNTKPIKLERKSVIVKGGQKNVRGI